MMFTSSTHNIYWRLVSQRGNLCSFSNKLNGKSNVMGLKRVGGGWGEAKVILKVFEVFDDGEESRKMFESWIPLRQVLFTKKCLNFVRYSILEMLGFLIRKL